MNTENETIPCQWLLLSSTAGYSSPAQWALSRSLEADGDTDEVPSSSLEPFRTKNSSRMSKRQKTRCLKGREDKAEAGEGTAELGEQLHTRRSQNACKEEVS